MGHTHDNTTTLNASVKAKAVDILNQIYKNSCNLKTPNILKLKKKSKPILMKDFTALVIL